MILKPLNALYRILCAAILSTALVSCTPASERPNELRIGTASQGGAFFPIGQSISTLVNQHAEDVTMVPIATFGSVGNPRLVNTREMDVAMSSNNLILLAKTGKGPYAKNGAMDIAALGPLHYSILHMMVLGNSDISSIADLKGKRLAVGPAGGGTIPFLTQVLALEDLTIDDIVPSYLSYADGFSQLSDGNVDAAFALSGFPAGAVMQAQAGKALKFISLTDAQLEKMLERSSNYAPVTVPKETYNTPEDGSVLGVINVLITQADAHEETVYRVTKAIYGNLEEFKSSNAIAKHIDLSDTAQINIPLHKGAQRYFDETGIKGPE